MFSGIKQKMCATDNVTALFKLLTGGFLEKYKAFICEGWCCDEKKKSSEQQEYHLYSIEMLPLI